MKKFILFAFCLLAFTGITATIMVSTGYEVKVGETTQTVTTARPNGNAQNGNTQGNGLNGQGNQSTGKLGGHDFESCLDTKLSTQASEEVSEAMSSKSNRYRTKIVFDVTLIDLYGYYGYFDDSIDYINKLFNDNDRTNDIYSVYEYFYDISFGKVSINANLLQGTLSKTYDELKGVSYDYYTEIAYLNTAKANGRRLTNTYGTANGNLAIYSGSSPNTNGNMLWAHTYRYLNFVSLTYGHANLGTICHEILHTFEIPDYYHNRNSSNNNALGYNDIMCSDSFGTNTCVYNKINLGWADVSNYEDNVESRVETISKNGTYTLQPASSFNGVIAYKFGAKSNNSKIYFMVEFRKPTDNGLDSYLKKTGLFVYRVNENYKMQGNLQSSNNDNNEIYMYGNNQTPSKGASFLSEEGCLYNLFDNSFRLMYNDNEQAKITLGNIQYNDDGSISFDYFNYNDSDIITGKTVYKLNGFIYPIKNVSVSLNGQFITKSNDYGEFILLNYSKASKYKITFTDPLGTYTFDEYIVDDNQFELCFYSKNTCYLSLNITNIESDDEILKVLVKTKYDKYEEIGTISKNKPFVMTDNSKFAEYSFRIQNYTQKKVYFYTTTFKIVGENIEDIDVEFNSQICYFNGVAKFKQIQNPKNGSLKDEIKGAVKVVNFVTNPFYALYTIAKGFFK